MLKFLNATFSSLHDLILVYNVLRLLVANSGYLVVIVEVHNVHNSVVCVIIAVLHIDGGRHGLILFLNYLVVVSSKFISECALNDATHPLELTLQ